MVLLLLAATLISAPAAAQDLGDADTREVNAFRLSEAGLVKYSRATEGLVAALADHPAACDGDADVESLDGTAASIDANASASAAIRAAGISSREYAVFTMSLVQSALGAWVVSEGGELPADIAMENVRFFQEHQMELQALIERSESVGCRGQENQGDDDPGWDEDESWDGDDESGG